jgi:hypothetical protein
MNHHGPERGKLRERIARNDLIRNGSEEIVRAAQAAATTACANGLFDEAKTFIAIAEMAKGLMLPL